MADIPNPLQSCEAIRKERKQQKERGETWTGGEGERVDGLRGR